MFNFCGDIHVLLFTGQFVKQIGIRRHVLYFFQGLEISHGGTWQIFQAAIPESLSTARAWYI